MTFTPEKEANSSPSKHRLPPIRLGGNAINQGANRPILMSLFAPVMRPSAVQKLSVRLSTASAASLVDSLRDGWAWQMRAMSSLLARKAMATQASAISSLA